MSKHICVWTWDEAGFNQQCRECGEIKQPTCEWCGQDLSELMSPNINELCIDCTGEE